MTLGSGSRTIKHAILREFNVLVATKEAKTRSSIFSTRKAISSTRTRHRHNYTRKRASQSETRNTKTRQARKCFREPRGFWDVANGTLDSSNHVKTSCGTQFDRLQPFLKKWVSNAFACLFLTRGGSPRKMVQSSFTMMFPLGMASAGTTRSARLEHC